MPNSLHALHLAPAASKPDLSLRVLALCVALGVLATSMGPSPVAAQGITERTPNRYTLDLELRALRAELRALPMPDRTPEFVIGGVLLGGAAATGIGTLGYVLSSGNAFCSLGASLSSSGCSARPTTSPSVTIPLLVLAGSMLVAGVVALFVGFGRQPSAEVRTRRPELREAMAENRRAARSARR